MINKKRRFWKKKKTYIQNKIGLKKKIKGSLFFLLLFFFLLATCLNIIECKSVRNKPNKIDKNKHSFNLEMSIIQKSIIASGLKCINKYKNLRTNYISGLFNLLFLIWMLSLIWTSYCCIYYDVFAYFSSVINCLHIFCICVFWDFLSNTFWFLDNFNNKNLYNFIQSSDNLPSSFLGSAITWAQKNQYLN